MDVSELVLYILPILKFLRPQQLAWGLPGIAEQRRSAIQIEGRI